ncbi:MAG: O-antigen ligase family protein [Patescibacteria group bacterium]|nr:O-antigen ligase family protein [Patescibacteria group bacterium]
MSTDNIQQKQMAVTTLISLFVLVFTFPFLKIDPLLLFWLLVIFFVSLIMFLDVFYGLILLLIARPVLDISSNLEIISVGPFSLNLAAILGIMTILFGITAIIKNKKKIRSLPLWWQWSLFLVVSFLSIAWSFSFSISISEWIRLGTVFSLLILGFLATNTFQETINLAKAIIFSAFIPAIFATYQFFTKNGFTLNFEDVPNRIFGTFAHPNPFAYFLTLVLSLSLFFILKNKNRQKLLATLFFFVALSLLVLTYTRGAWLVLLGVIMLIGIVKYRKFLVLSLFLFLFAYIAIAPIHSRINSLVVQGPSSSIKWRLELWKDSLDYISERPFYGFGIGTSEEVILQKRGFQFGSTIPHNDYLKLAIDTGIVGLASFIVLITSLLLLWLKRLKQEASSNPEKYLLLLIFTSFTATILTASAIDNILDATALQWAFWSMAGALIATTQRKNDQQPIS